MFSGIIEEVGTVCALSDSKDGRRLKIEAVKVLNDMKIGDSVAVSGACLTVIEFTSQCFACEISWETLRKTKLGKLRLGSQVNLESSLKLSNRLGGHLVSGHIDGIATVSSIIQEGFSKIYAFSLNNSFSPYLIEKGSIAVDGISLTVASLQDNTANPDEFIFTIAAIPHTLAVTTLESLRVGDLVNIEVDMIGKYVLRWLATSNKQTTKKELSFAWLAEQGYT